MHEYVTPDAFSQTDGNLDGTSAMIGSATSGYFVVHCCCLAVPLYHSLPDLYTFLEGTSTLSDFPDEAVREGEKIIVP